ncbi:Uma2 family endonuclease [Pantanalinema rosaneae CENA516]|uniref:Uma2 family endonuclease n=1 Tax=Pantanalinema rosaneae TaxID=1620701 RepID=UPI003D6EABEF
MTLTAVKWTVDEYHRLIDAGFLDNKHVELLDGAIVEMSPEGIPHADLSDEAGIYLRGLLGEQAKVREGKPITLPNQSEPEPDLCICQNIRYNAHHPYPENIFWVVEYSNSSLEKDLTVKPIIYASAGIPEYWVVNLKAQKVIVFRDPMDGEYQQRQTVSQGSITPLAFPDIVVASDRLVE